MNTPLKQAALIVGGSSLTDRTAPKRRSQVNYDGLFDCESDAKCAGLDKIFVSDLAAGSRPSGGIQLCRSYSRPVDSGYFSAFIACSQRFCSAQVRRSSSDVSDEVRE
ncbi:hypothetical protein [Nocardia vaccinii]|uniref:hypothetical protein n=1 Tax=Nocardia vaccinii TaxID=1822 RepID=UPI0012F4CFD1|nr:hypothetical protein [Nocardia vaccinii]